MRRPSKDTIIRKFQVLTDQREQKPFTYAGQTEFCTLKAGDYSIRYGGVNYSNKILVERKGDPSELFSATGGERERFERELVKLAQVDIAFVVCEWDFLEIVRDQPPGILPASAVYGSICSWHARFNIPFIFCGNRANARLYTYKVFYEYVKHKILKEAEDV